MPEIETTEAPATSGELQEHAAEEKADEQVEQNKVVGALQDIRAEVRDITDQNDLADRVASKVLNGVTAWLQSQSGAANNESSSQEMPPPPTEGQAQAGNGNPTEEDVKPRRSHRMFRKIGRKEE